MPAAGGFSFPGANSHHSGAKRLYNIVGRPKAERVPRRRRVFCPGAKRPQSGAKRLFYCPPQAGFHSAEAECFARLRRGFCPGAKRLHSGAKRLYDIDCRPKAEKILPAAGGFLAPRGTLHPDGRRPVGFREPFGEVEGLRMGGRRAIYADVAKLLVSIYQNQNALLCFSLIVSYF